MDKKLRVIPEPVEGTRTTLKPAIGKVTPVLKGSGKLNLLCGNCSRKLAEGIEEGWIRDVVIYCPYCGYYNEIL